MITAPYSWLPTTDIFIALVRGGADYSGKLGRTYVAVIGIIIAVVVVAVLVVTSS
jgi:hypothetical protein